MEVSSCDLTKAIILWSGLFLSLCLISQHFSPQIFMTALSLNTFSQSTMLFFFFLALYTYSFIVKAQLLILHSLGCRALSSGAWLTWVFLQCLHWLCKSGLRVLSLCPYRLFTDSHLQRLFLCMIIIWPFTSLSMRLHMSFGRMCVIKFI